MKVCFDSITPEAMETMEKVSGIGPQQLIMAFNSPDSRIMKDPDDEGGRRHILKTTIAVKGRKRVFMCFFLRHRNYVVQVLSWRPYQAIPDNGYDFSKNPIKFIGKEKSKVAPVRFSSELYNKPKEYAKVKHVPMSWAIRRAVEKELETYERSERI